MAHFLLSYSSPPPFTSSLCSISKSPKEPVSSHRLFSGLPTTRKEFRCNCCSLWASQAQPKGESVVVVESDKAAMDVGTFYDGYLAAIMVEEGVVAAVGSPLALLAETEDEIDHAKYKANSSSSSSSSSAPPPAAELAPSSAEPQLEKIADNAGPTSAAKAAPSVVLASSHPASEGGKRIVASPYAKKLAKELKVELGRIVGTGPLGRIGAKDVEDALAACAAPASFPRGVDSASTVPGKSAGIELGSVVPFTTMQSAVSRNMVDSPAVPTFRLGYTITTDAFDAPYKKVDIYSLSRKWKELVDKARAKQLQPHEYNTANDITIEDLEDVGRSSRWVSTFLFGQILSVISPLVAYASDTLKTNEIYEIGELFDLGIQLLYLILLLGLLGVGSYFVIRQVLVRRELDLSAKELQEQVRSGDASATELFELGAVMLRRKFYPAATKYLLEAIEKWDGDDQDLAQVYNALGVSYVRDEKLDKGIAQFETAVKLQPGYVTAWNNLGDAYEKKKEYKAALRAFEEVLLFDPNNKVARPRRDAMKERVQMYKGVPVKSKER